MAFDKVKFIDEMKNMSVLELNDLVKAIEEEFGVSAAAAVAVAGPASADAAADAEKTVVLKNAGGSKINVIKALREITGLGLKESKELADNGGNVKENLKADEAEKVMAQLVEAGAEVELV